MLAARGKEKGQGPSNILRRSMLAATGKKRGQGPSNILRRRSIRWLLEVRRRGRDPQTS